jgi:hypothetical protein
LAGQAFNGNQVQIWNCTAKPESHRKFTPTCNSIHWTGAPGSVNMCLELTDPLEPWLSYVQVWGCNLDRGGQELQLSKI